MIDRAKLLACANQLRPLSLTTSRLAAVVADDTSTLDDTVKIIELDQALTVLVLKLANSAMSASNRSIVSVRQAVVRLGGGRILENIVAQAVRSDMQKPLGTYGYNEDALWRHSVAAAIAAESLRCVTSCRIGGEAFTAALLHDIGKLVLERCASQEDCERIIEELQKDPEITFEMAETRILGISHPQIGADIAVQWALPEDITIAIRDHHQIDTPPHATTDAVRIANIVARTIGEGLGNEGMGLQIDEGAIDRFQLTREGFEELCAITSGKVETILESYGT